MLRRWLLLGLLPELAQSVELVVDGRSVQLEWEPTMRCEERYVAALRALQGPAPVIGQGCASTECSALVVVDGVEECAAFAQDRLADVQLQRRHEHRNLPAKGSSTTREERDEAVSFHRLYADVGAALQYELAHYEAGLPLPPAYLAALAKYGWQLMPGPWPTTFPQTWVARVDELRTRKRCRFSFVGGLRNDKSTEIMRRWVLDFADRHCHGANCSLAFTDIKRGQGWNPKLSNPASSVAAAMASKPREDWLRSLENDSRSDPSEFLAVVTSRFVVFDRAYFETLCASELTLAPAGDGPWSRRFFEAALCCSIPVVQRREHAGRTDAELRLGYRFYVYDPSQPTSFYEYRQDWADHNLQLFLRTATLSSSDTTASCPPAAVVLSSNAGGFASLL